MVTILPWRGNHCLAILTYEAFQKTFRSSVMLKRPKK